MHPSRGKRLTEVGGAALFWARAPRLLRTGVVLRAGTSRGRGTLSNDVCGVNGSCETAAFWDVGVICHLSTSGLTTDSFRSLFRYVLAPVLLVPRHGAASGKKLVQKKCDSIGCFVPQLHSRLRQSKEEEPPITCIHTLPAILSIDCLCRRSIGRETDQLGTSSVEQWLPLLVQEVVRITQGFYPLTCTLYTIT